MVALGQVSLAVQYIDGTKIESVANKYTFVWKKATLTNKAKLEEKIKSVLKQIDEGIAQDNAPSKEEETMTDAIDSEHLQQLIDKVNEENSRLAQDSKEDKEKARQRQKAVNKLQKHQEKLKEYEDKLDTMGFRNSYSSWIDTYRAQRCEGCPLRGQCFKGKGNRTINVNHKLKRYKKKAFERLTSERGLFHRSKRPVEPEAVFGQIKTDKQYKRFRHKSFPKIQMDFGILAMAFNLQKLIKNVGKDQIKAVMEAFSTLIGPLLASL